MLAYQEGKEHFANREFAVVHVTQLYPDPPHSTITIRPGDIEKLVAALLKAGFKKDIDAAMKEYYMNLTGR